MNKIENYLNNLPKTQIYMLYILTLIIFAGILYNFIPDLMDKEASLQSSIEKKSKTLHNISIPRLIKVYKQDKMIYLKEQENLQKKKEDINLLISKLYSLDFIFFNDKKWIDTLDTMLNKSLKYNIKINSIENDDNTTVSKESLIRRKKHIVITGTGEYKNIVKYIHYIESMPILLRFNEVNFRVDNNASIDFDVKFDTYGAGL